MNKSLILRCALLVSIFTTSLSCIESDIVVKGVNSMNDFSTENMHQEILTVQKILSYLDENSLNNEHSLFPKFMSQEEYFYGKSKITLFRNKNEFLILIEEIIFHSIGKISNQSYFFGNALDHVKLNSKKNIHYKTIFDYDSFESILHEDGQFYPDVSKDILINNKGIKLSLNTNIEDYSLTFDKMGGSTTENYVNPEVLFWNILDNNPSDLFFLTKSDLTEVIPSSFSRIDSTENWYYEDLTDGISSFIVKKPSKSKFFKEAAMVLCREKKAMEFPLVNSTWYNWIE